MANHASLANTQQGFGSGTLARAAYAAVWSSDDAGALHLRGFWRHETPHTRRRRPMASQSESESERLADIARKRGTSVVIEAPGFELPRPSGGAILQQDCHTPQFDRVDWYPTLEAALAELQRMATEQGVTVTGCRAAFSWGTAEVKL